MYAHRQIYNDIQATIPVPAELQHRKTEVIFMALDNESIVTNQQSLADALAHPASKDIEFEATSVKMGLKQVEF